MPKDIDSSLLTKITDLHVQSQTTPPQYQLKIESENDGQTLKAKFWMDGMPQYPSLFKWPGIINKRAKWP